MGPRRVERLRFTSSGSETIKPRRKIKASRGLRIAILTSGILAAVVLLTVGLTGLRSQQTRPEAPMVKPRGPTASDNKAGGAVARILQPSEVGNGFATVESGSQGIAELTSRLSPAEAEAEASRLRSLGFIEAAIAIAYKPPTSVPPLTDTSVTVQIVQFSTPEAAMAQLIHDKEGALAQGFGISDPYEKSEYQLPDVQFGELRGVLLRKAPAGSLDSKSNDSTTDTGSKYILATAIAFDKWEIIVELRSSNPPPTPEIERILGLQIDKLRM